MKKFPLVYNKLEPIINLISSYSGKINPGEYKYFVFNSKSEKDNIIFIRATPGQNKIALFASTSIIYPNIKESQFKTNIKPDLLGEDFISDMGRDFEPFTLDNDNNLIYSENPINKIQKIPSQNSVAIKIHTYHSGLSDGRIFMSILNISSEETDFTINIKEIKEIDLMPQRYIQKHLIFNQLFFKIEGSSVSQMERSMKKLGGKSEFTYGEIELSHFITLLHYLSIKPGGVFWDLGCGAGKAMIAAALSECNFSKICGVELLDGLYELCNNVIATYQAQNNTEKLIDFKIIHGDMTNTDWFDADVIYTSSICFPEPLINQISELGAKLKPGTIILTLKNFPHSNFYQVLANFRVKMTWGMNGVYVLKRI